MPLTRKEIDKRYYKKNKEKIHETARLYRLNNKEKVNESNKLYREKNKEKEKKRKKLYREKNLEKVNESNKIYYQNNKEKVNETKRLYKIKNAKKIILDRWKKAGIIDTDIDEFYEYYLKQTHCWICFKKYSNERMDLKCLDHDHNTGEPRYICCNYCNLKIVG